MIAQLSATQLRKYFVRINRIYILPTGLGLIYILANIAVVLVAATYFNNLVFFLSFLMLASLLMAMVKTNYALAPVSLEFVESLDGQAGDHVRLVFRLLNGSKNPIPSLIVRPASKALFLGESFIYEVPSTGHDVIVNLPAPGRGVYACPEMVVETRAPLGLFRSWKHFRLRGMYFIYAAPSGRSLRESAQTVTSPGRAGMAPSREGDVDQLRPYRKGESYHRIDWKLFARTRELFSKQEIGSAVSSFQFDLRRSPRANREARLSQMALWLNEALAMNAQFSLRVGSQVLPLGSGENHWRRCQRLLAEEPFS